MFDRLLCLPTPPAFGSFNNAYVPLTLAAKEATWLRLLLTELGLLQPTEQYAEIKIAERSTGAAEIKANLRDQEKERRDSLFNATPSNTTAPLTDVTKRSISLKGKNQGSIALAHNPVYHARTKHIDIQHYYICDEVAAGRIDLQYIPTSEMVADELTKALTHAKFHGFVKQMNME